MCVILPYLCPRKLKLLEEMKKFLLIGAAALMVSNSTFAGGILTNTNQNATFLRNPARNAAIAIDGVYSNPAGIAFLPQGFHLSVSWQAAFQKRLMDVNNNLFGMNANNQSTSREFVGETNAPVIPSFQAAYVINDKWSVSAQFAVGGGGGACEFAEGLPMFEELIGGIVYKNGGTSYALNIGKPSANSHAPPPPPTANCADTDHLSLITYAAWKEGITGAFVLPTNSRLVLWLFAFIWNKLLFTSIKRFWIAACQLTDK